MIKVQRMKKKHIHLKDMIVNYYFSCRKRNDTVKTQILEVNNKGYLIISGLDKPQKVDILKT